MYICTCTHVHVYEVPRTSYYGGIPATLVLWIPPYSYQQMIFRTSTSRTGVCTQYMYICTYVHSTHTEYVYIVQGRTWRVFCVHMYIGTMYLYRLWMEEFRKSSIIACLVRVSACTVPGWFRVWGKVESVPPASCGRYTMYKVQKYICVPGALV